jgi:hypothetical protein
MTCLTGPFGGFIPATRILTGNIARNIDFHRAILYVNTVGASVPRLCQVLTLSLTIVGAWVVMILYCVGETS